MDDYDIADRLDMNRHHVNQICRRLSSDGLIDRWPGSSCKLVNRLGSGQVDDMSFYHESVWVRNRTGPPA